jgi:hypothetical protein
LFSINGQLVCSVFDEYVPGGVSKTITYRNIWPQGIYNYQIRSEKQMINGRLIIIREY